jgi:hypothetical protein
MRAFMMVLALAATTMSATACGGRRVEVVDTAPRQAEVSLHVTNNLTQAVNVYVLHSGDTHFVGQVAARSTQHLPVANVAAGTTVSLRATRADGAQSYDRANIQLVGTFTWQIP